MAKRKKRLEKGIDSLDEQIKLHEEKKQKAHELGQEELERYFDKEINALKERKKQREEVLDKQ